MGMDMKEVEMGFESDRKKVMKEWNKVEDLSDEVELDEIV